MKEKSIQQSGWKKTGIALLALAGGFFLSFLGFGLLWSGIPWHFQLLMFFPFLLLTWVISRCNQGAVDGCVCILLGAAPLGILIMQFRDNNDSHLLPVLMVICWLIGVIAGFFLAKISVNSNSEPSDDMTRRS